jgi:hypothetical protein
MCASTRRSTPAPTASRWVRRNDGRTGGSALSSRARQPTGMCQKIERAVPETWGLPVSRCRGANARALPDAGHSRSGQVASASRIALSVALSSMNDQSSAW